MQHNEGFFADTTGATIYHQCWLPEGEPKAVLILVHGLGEHSGRYMNVVNHLAPLGYALYAIDHIGHGKSSGQRVYVDSFDDYIATLKQFRDMVAGWQPEKPTFLIGHSMGGLISSLFLAVHPQDVSGAVLSGPAVKLPEGTSALTITAGKVLSFLLPTTGLVALDASAVSRDPAVVAAYLADPLVYSGKLTARLAAEMLTSMQRIGVDAGKIRVPLLIMQGTADRLVNPAGAPMLHGLVWSIDKTLKLYDGLYHEIFNEPEHEQVLNDVADWLAARQ
jgi:acylglycerol lipase